MADIKFLLTFYLFIFALTLISFPLTAVVFKNLKDRGFLFSKILSLLIMGYLYFLALASGIAGHSSVTFILIFIVFILLAVFSIRKRKEELLQFIRANWKLLLFEEIMFLSLFMAAAVIKMGDPAIIGAEKFPDFSIYNRLIIEKSFPPLDNWLCSFPINYYYLGHLVFAAITKLTGIPSEYGYNICLAFILSSIFSFSFSIIYSLSGKKILGIASGICVTFAGNLDGLFQVISSGDPSLFWWNPSRVIKGTINEFPFFSFLLGDLHAHFISIPVIFCFLALLADIFLGRSTAKTDAPGRIKLPSFLHILIFSILGGFILSSNPWFFPVVVLMLLGTLLISAADSAAKTLDILSGPAISASIVVTVSAVLFLPFLLNYSAPLSGFGIVPIELLSRPVEYFSMFGLPLTLLAFHIVLSLSPWNLKEVLYRGIAVSILAVLLSVFRPSIITVLLFAMASLYSCLIFDKKSRQIHILTIFIALLILLMCEVVFLRDTYGYEFLRMNTVFKFHFIAFTMMMLFAPLIADATVKMIKNPLIRYMFILICTVLFTISLVYPISAVYSKNFYNKRGDFTFSLDGMLFFKPHLLDEHNAIIWIRNNTGINDVIVEATGKPYDYFSRFSTFSGRPTILGWGNHERVWRPYFYDQTAARESDIDLIYSSKDKKGIIPVLQKYKAKYIVVGEREKRLYRQESLMGFDSIFQTVFEEGRVRIYLVN